LGWQFGIVPRNVPRTTPCGQFHPLENACLDKTFTLMRISEIYFTLLHSSIMAQPAFNNLSLERRGNIFILTLEKPPENRLNSAFCQEIIRAFHYVQKALGPVSEGALITRGQGEKFWCTGLELDEGDDNPFANTDGFYPMLHTIMDFPFPTIALLTGHTFGGAVPFSLCHDYRVMNSKRGFISMVRWSRTLKLWVSLISVATSKSRPSLRRYWSTPTTQTSPPNCSKNAARST
jgi:hypothetical protein